MSTFLPFPIHPEGFKFLLIFIVLTCLGFYFSKPLGWIGLILIIWCAYFFRDPPRVSPQREGLILSPADGVISLITKTTAPEGLDLGEKEFLRVSIFMNPFNCHINRSPLEAKIEKILYHSGKFFNASLDKASEHNERQSFLLKTKNNEEIIVVQIAGLLARRIVRFVEEEKMLLAGERFGLIRFGSRLDVYLPKETPLLVALGQKMIAGETIIADLKSKESTRETKKD